MRYALAMLTAAIAAALAAVLFSGSIANWTVRQFTFESPDSVASLHTAVFMLCNLAALAIGWVIGWLLGARLTVGAD